MKRTLSWVFAGISLIFLASSPAHAVPVGTFSWYGNSDLGAVFAVENTSADPSSLGGDGISFFDIFVDIYPTDPIVLPDPVIPLGSVDPIFFIVWTTDNLSNLNVSSAHLRLTPSLPGVITVADLTAPGSVTIDYSPAQAVPEPATVLLLGGGLVGLGIWRSRGRRPEIPS